MIDKILVRRHFDRSAREYDRYAEVQREMAEELVRRLRRCDRNGKVRRVLEIGCGTGFLTERLIRCYPDACLTAVDLSENMVACAREKLSSLPGKRRFVVADAETWAKDGDVAACDLIVSNAAFQWFSDPEGTARHLLRRLNPGGRLAFSTFGPRTFCELHASFRAAKRIWACLFLLTANLFRRCANGPAF